MWGPYSRDMPTCGDFIREGCPFVRILFEGDTYLCRLYSWGMLYSKGAGSNRRNTVNRSNRFSLVVIVCLLVLAMALCCYTYLCYCRQPAGNDWTCGRPFVALFRRISWRKYPIPTSPSASHRTTFDNLLT